MKNFINALFKEGEHGCFSDNPYETKVLPVVNATEQDCYITLNPLKPGHTRADKNVVEYRNFLIEFDDLPLEDQLDYVESIGLPYNTCVFSGNKSLHFIITLTNPVSSRLEYDSLVRWIYAAVPKADKSCKNPSRFTRLGGGTHKNGALQELKSVCGGISQINLTVWLQGICNAPVSMTKSMKQMATEDFLFIQESGHRAKMHSATRAFCRGGGRPGSRHRNLFIAACNLRDCYYTLEEAKVLCLSTLEKIYKKEGRSEADLYEKELAIESAYQHAPKEYTRG